MFNHCFSKKFFKNFEIQSFLQLKKFPSTHYLKKKLSNMFKGEIVLKKSVLGFFIQYQMEKF